jgi:transposase
VGVAVSANRSGIAPQADFARENERLRLEHRILKEERGILKKATQFFASQRQ